VLEFRTSATSLVEFGSLLDTLHVVDVDTWLTAMPDSVIKQADVMAVITDMLTGIPLPEGFDSTSLADDDQINDRYQLGARVVSAVSCIWIEQWINAKATGDTVAAGAAADAMRTSSMWPIIQEMNQSGDYGKALQMHVDAMTDNPPPLGLGGPTLEESYRLALGCPE
jgi:hypothetical protein